MARHLGGGLLATACVVGLSMACFGPAVGDGRQLAYRDFSDFYYPLYQRVQQEWEAGRLPLWASEENGGYAAARQPDGGRALPRQADLRRACPTPGRPTALRGRPRAAGLRRRCGAARGPGRSRPVGSTLGGLAYAFGAPVLIQYCNIIFLVGAAWMPLGFWFADGWVRLRRPGPCRPGRWCWRMQVLGGDPEAAYLTAFAAGAYAIGRWIAGESPGRRPSDLRRGVLASCSPRVPARAGVAHGLPVLAQDVAASLVASLPPAGESDRLGRWPRWSVVVRWRMRRGRAGLEGSLIGLLAALRSWRRRLTAVQLLPVLEFIGQSTRGEGAPHDIYALQIHPAGWSSWSGRTLRLRPDRDRSG